jgi:hypothetical protein
MKKKKSEMYRNEIKSYIVRAGMTMSEVVDYLADEYRWSSSVPNLSGKLKRGSLRYGEAVAEYERCSNSPLGRLIASRELPILKGAREILADGSFE